MKNNLKILLRKYLLKEETEAENLRKEAEKQFFKEKEMEKWFIVLLKQLRKKQNIDYSYFIDWVDKNTNEVYMRYNKVSKDLYIDYKSIWLFFRNNYSKDNEKIKELIRFVMEQHLDMWDIESIGGLALK